MFPDNRFSSSSVPGQFILPRPEDIFSDTSWGGIALQNSSQGLAYQIWTLKWNPRTFEVTLQAPNYPPQVLLTENKINALGLAFDQNMNLVYFTTRENVTSLNWFDSSINQRRVTEFFDLAYPCLALDDTRNSQREHSDVILAYLKNNQLSYRLERDRYAIERYHSDTFSDSDRLIQIGMTTKWRFQFEVIRWRK